MKDKICVMTATRAEYGQLRRIIQRLIKKDYDVRVAVTGAHLSDLYGNTIKEIESDGVEVDAKIDILADMDNAIGIADSVAAAVTGFARYFNETQPSLLIVLGDRYETLAVCTAAMVMRVPIAHLHGGETTEGAIDECIRHSVSKMSYLHFTSCEEYRKRVIQLGEDPARVFNVGGMGVENIIHTEYLSKKELFKELQLNFYLDTPYAVVTFHPVTLEKGTYESQIQELLSALDVFNDMNFIITKANADEGGRKINDYLEDYAVKHLNARLFDSLGTKRYLNALKHAEMVIGNSSSGILEVPSFGIPTINIGDRQRGRIQASSIINCKAEKNEIVDAIKIGKTIEFRSIAQNCKNPYGDGHTSEKIVDIIDNFISKKQIDLKKHFYDLGGKNSVCD